AAVGERVVSTIRRDLYAHIQGMSLSFFTSIHSGELVARIISDVSRIARLTSTLLVNVVRDVASVVGLLVVMFARDWRLALIAAAVFPFIGITIRALGRRLYSINLRSQRRTAELTIALQESFTGAKTIQAFGQEAGDQARFDRVNGRILALALKDARIDQLSGPLMEILGAIGIMGALWYGGSRVMAHTLTPGEFFSFTAAVFLLYGPVRQISRAINSVRQSPGSLA